MSILAEDDNLCIRVAVVLPLDASLQLQHHWAGGIDNLDVVALRQLIGRRRLTMCPQQHLCSVQLLQVVVVDGDESLLVQALHLHAVVHDVTQTIERRTQPQFLLCLLDGGGHTETESTAVVNLNLNHQESIILSSPLSPPSVAQGRW